MVAHTASASRPLARPWRSSAGASQAPKPSAEIPAPETGEISSSQRRDTTDRGRTRIPPAACTRLYSQLQICTTQNPVTYVGCGFGAVHRRPPRTRAVFVFFREHSQNRIHLKT
jgi:hypothetical protein